MANRSGHTSAVCRPMSDGWCTRRSCILVQAMNRAAAYSRLANRLNGGRNELSWGCWYSLA